MSRLRLRRRRDELSVVEMQRYNPLRVGIVFLVILVIAVYFGFTKSIPFKHPYKLKAVFATGVNISPQGAGTHRRCGCRQGHLARAPG